MELTDELKLALFNLVKLKEHKDEKGKDDFYNEYQPKMWQYARQVLKACEGKADSTSEKDLRIAEVSTCPSIQFFNVDCMEFMKSKPDKCYDLAIVDPPYGLGFDGGNIGGNNRGKSKKYTQKDWDKMPPSEVYFKELQRVSKNQIVFGANHFISKLPIDSSCWIVWDKQSGGNFADCELAWTSFNTAVRKFTYTWNGFRQGPTCQVIETRIHPTQKPTSLYRWILQNYATKGMKILDTHGGSMSISISCDLEGFDLDICEIDPEYFSNGVKAYEMHKRQQRLF